MESRTGTERCGGQSRARKTRKTQKRESRRSGADPRHRVARNQPTRNRRDDRTRRPRGSRFGRGHAPRSQTSRGTRTARLAPSGARVTRRGATRGRAADADDRGRLKTRKTKADGRVVRSRREGHEDAPADLRPRLCGSSSSATPCLLGGAPSRPRDRHSVTDRHRSPPPDALSRGAVRWPLPASTLVLTAPRAELSPPETPPAGPCAASDNLPSSLPRARYSGTATAADAPVPPRPRTDSWFRRSSEATTGLETGSARRFLVNGSRRATNLSASQTIFF